MVPQMEGFGAIMPSSIAPDMISLESPLICAVATAVVATKVATDVISIFITR